MKMLIVDDSLIIRRKIEREIQLPQLTEVVSAKNGQEALEVFRNVMPDLVTMDLTMPEMDGVACVKELVRIKPDTIILVVSALADKATAIKAIKNGAHGFLCKPFTETELNAAITKLMALAKERGAS